MWAKSMGDNILPINIYFISYIVYCQYPVSGIHEGRDL